MKQRFPPLRARWRTVFLTVLISFVVSGCSRLFSRDHLVISPHLETNVQEEIGNELIAETYSGLKSAILSLIQNSREEGLIRLYNYPSDAVSDVRKACMESTMEEPLGVYAVEYMSFECIRVLTYYEVTINITYQRTPDQINSILQIANTADFRDRLEETFLDYGSGFTAQVLYYYPDQYDIAAILEGIYYNHPLYGSPLPSYTVHLYPENGWHRIVEIELSYGNRKEQLLKLSKALVDQTDLVIDKIPNPVGFEAILSMDSELRERVRYLPDPENALDGGIQKDSTFTAYGALVEGESTSEGYALAFKALCDRLGIKCQVLRGRYNGIDHCWNLVYTEKGWYHVDTALNDDSGSDQFLLKTDEQMSQHKWNATNYPKSSTEVYVAEAPVQAETTPAP